MWIRIIAGLLGKQLLNRRLQAGRAGVGILAVNCAFTGKAGEAAAGFLDQDFERGQIPGFGAGLDPDIGETLGDEHGIDRASQAANRPELLYPGKQAGADGADSGFIEAVEGQDGVFRVGLTGDPNGRAVGPGATAFASPEQQALAGAVRDADDDFAILFEPDQNGPERDAADEVAGAVDGIDDPLPGVLAGATAALFAEQAVGREFARDLIEDQLFASAVGGGDGRFVGFGLSRDATALVIERKCAGLLRQ
jgi:hypothetical protein